MYFRLPLVYQLTIKEKTMKTQIIALTKAQVKEQIKFAAKYKALIEKELSYGDLMNLDNINIYAKAMKAHSALAQNGCVEIPINA